MDYSDTQRWAGKGILSQNLGTGPDRGPAGSPDTTRGLPTLDEMNKKREEVRKLRGRAITRIIPNQTAGTDGSEGRTLRASRGGAIQKEAPPDGGGKTPHKEFLKAGLLKRPQKYQPEIVALCEICWFKKSTELLICKHPFSHLVHKIAQEVGRYDLHFQVCTVMALQEAAEYYLTSLLEDANLCMNHTKYITIMPNDMQLAHHTHGEHLHY